MKRLLFIIFLSVGIGHIAASDFTQLIQQYGDNGDFSRMDSVYLKSATTRLYDTEAKIICIVSKKGAQCIECHHKDI